MSDEWVWDADKARWNLAKHGIRFDIAIRVFDDPARVTILDEFPAEERWVTIGRPAVGELLTLVVVYTDPNGEDGAVWPRRVISARQATRFERRLYDQGEP